MGRQSPSSRRQSCDPIDWEEILSGSRAVVMPRCARIVGSTWSPQIIKPPSGFEQAQVVDCGDRGVDRQNSRRAKLDRSASSTAVRGVAWQTAGRPHPLPSPSSRSFAGWHLVTLRSMALGAGSGVASAVHRIGDKLVVLAVGRQPVESFLVLVRGVHHNRNRRWVTRFGTNSRTSVPPPRK